MRTLVACWGRTRRHGRPWSSIVYKEDTRPPLIAYLMSGVGPSSTARPLLSGANMVSPFSTVHVETPWGGGVFRSSCLICIFLAASMCCISAQD
ncbi:hypothetical protein GW17_00027631 [Ensete ventricosum]|nr:hypothetical protein GW17_00027631 [Ensete ventricosum]